jgi:hypothetical protein
LIGAARAHHPPWRIAAEDDVLKAALAGALLAAVVVGVAQAADERSPPSPSR